MLGVQARQFLLCRNVTLGGARLVHMGRSNMVRQLLEVPHAVLFDCRDGARWVVHGGPGKSTHHATQGHNLFRMPCFVQYACTASGHVP